MFDDLPIVCPFAAIECHQWSSAVSRTWPSDHTNDEIGHTASAITSCLSYGTAMQLMPGSQMKVSRQGVAIYGCQRRDGHAYRRQLGQVLTIIPRCCAIKQRGEIDRLIIKQKEHSKELLLYKAIYKANIPLSYNTPPYTLLIQ